MVSGSKAVIGVGRGIRSCIRVVSRDPAIEIIARCKRVINPDQEVFTIPGIDLIERKADRH